MNRIVVLGGGVGGTLVANLIAKKLRAPDLDGDVEITLVDEIGRHVYQPGFMYIAMGGERAEKLQRPERSLLDRRVDLVVGEVPASTSTSRRSSSRMARSSATTSWSSRPGPGSSPRRSRSSTSEAHHFYSAEAALRLRHALDPFTGGRIVIGIAGMPYKCPPAPLEVAFLIEAELRERGLRDELRAALLLARSAARSRSRACREMATPILEEKGIELHTFFNVETIDPERKVVESLEGEELPYDLLILVPPHKGAQVLIDCGLAPARGGWLPTDRDTSRWAAAPNVYALGDATDLPLSKAGSTAHFEAPVVAERIAAARRAASSTQSTAIYTGRVMCFFEVGDGKGTLLRFDYDHPPKPPQPNRLWHLGKIVFNKTYWHTVPKGRV